jgi:hypothetical protein
MMDDDEWGVVDGVGGRETEVPGENLPQCLFVHRKFRITGPGLEHGPLQWETGD